MRIKTISEENVVEGAVVESYKLADGVEIPAILVGEEGRGRKLGVLPVQLRDQSYKIWAEKGQVNVCYGNLGRTRSGKPKLIETTTAEDEWWLLVLRSPIGYRGSNTHILPRGADVIVQGVIAQGAAGRMGSGEQMVVWLPADAGDLVVEISGRRYGCPDRYVYRIKDGDVTVVDPLDLDAEELLPFEAEGGYQ